MRKATVFGIVLCLLLVLTASAPATQRRRGKPRPKLAAVCGDPTARCRTEYTFEPYNLPFFLSSNAVIYETEKFYAIILKSVRDDKLDGTIFVPETERIEAQQLFPHNKVFTSRDNGMPGDLYYSSVKGDQKFMAVYAGRTQAEAKKMLAKVKATGKFPGANLRRMHAGFNGT
ncbi:MAG: hypothetical protein H7Z38_00400 [Rubrivivax sp.]|nr:hypothetical protein [Pyrinomonadaceae bacterium]